MSKRYILIILFIVVGISAVVIYNKIFKTIDKDTVNDIDVLVNTNDDYESINWNNYEEKEIEPSGTLNIDKEGVYRLKGNYEGNIVVNTNGNVKLILDGVSIKSNNGPVIMVENAKNTVIYLNEENNNTLEDSSSYNGLDEKIDAVIYSKDTLIFDGSGSLTIKANYKNAIVSNDDLIIMNGNYNIDSVGNGIKGKDSIYIMDGNYNIKSMEDGIKSTNNEDSSKGFIKILNGKFKLESTLDSIQAESNLVIENGEFDIITGGGSINSSSKETWGMWGNQVNVDKTSAKGLKSGSNLVIKSGKFVINSSDDSIHSNGSIGISDGEINIKSGDDALHADEKIVIDGGSILVNDSYEGIEASNIVINGGNISVKSSDDGINVAGGNDESSMNRPGQNNFKNTTNNKLVVNGGNIYVNATGDGIDSNGSVYVYDGVIYVDGPEETGNGALDYDGEFVMDGGTLVAVGSKGMLQGISDNSKQYNLTVYLDKTYNEASISLVSEDDTVLETYAPNKSFSSIVISSNRLVKSKTYKLEINGEVIETFKVENISTILGETLNNFGGGKQPGGRRPR